MRLHAVAEALLETERASPIATVVTDNRRPDNPILAANDAFTDLTGYSAEEIIGRNCRFLGGAGSEPEARAALKQAIAEGRPAVVELWNYRKNGTPFRNAIMIAPVFDDMGDPLFYVGTQMELSSRTAQGLGLNQSRRRVLALTPKQRQVLKLMTNGQRDSQIGEQLGIGISAVKRLRARLLQKLGVKTSADALRIGIEAGLAA